MTADVVLALIVAATWLAAAVIVGYTCHTQRKGHKLGESVSPASHSNVRKIVRNEEVERR